MRPANHLTISSILGVVILSCLLPINNAAAQENLDELVARKGRQADNTFYPGPDTAPSYFFQPMTLCYAETSYGGHEVWRITNTANKRCWAQEEYGYPSVWSADGKRYHVAMDVESSAFGRSGTLYPLYYFARADGSRFRIGEDGPCRSVRTKYGMNWSPIEPDVFFQCAHTYYGAHDGYVEERYLYKTTVSDGSISATPWIDFGNSTIRAVRKTMAPDGRKAVAYSWIYRQPYTSCTLYPAGVGRPHAPDASWDLDDPERAWSTHWGQADTTSDHVHNIHFVGNYDIGYWIYTNRSSSSYSWWKMRPTGSGSDGGPVHVDDITSPYAWWPDGEIQPANTMRGDRNDPWCDDGDPATACGEYWSHPNFYRDGQLCCFSNTESSPIAPGVYDSANREWATESYDEDYGIQHTNWNAFSDWTAHWSGISDKLIWTGRYNDASAEVRLANNHEEGSADDDGVNQSPDGTKLMWGSSFLNTGTGENYNDVFWVVAYYPFPPEITACTATGGTVTTRFDWQLDSGTRGYTTRGWPDPDSDNPPPPRETEEFRLWRSANGSTWTPQGTVNANIFTKYDFPTGNRWNSGQTSYWEITDTPGNGTWYYAVTSKEWSGLESVRLSNVYRITVSGGAGSGNQTAAYPGELVDGVTSCNFYSTAPSQPTALVVTHQKSPATAAGQYTLDMTVPLVNNDLFRYVNVYASDGSDPAIDQRRRIASIPVSEFAGSSYSWVDWLGNTNGSTRYGVTIVDTMGNESGLTLAGGGGDIVPPDPPDNVDATAITEPPIP